MSQIIEIMNSLVNEVKAYNAQEKEDKKQNCFSFEQEKHNLSVMITSSGGEHLMAQRDLILLYFHDQKELSLLTVQKEELENLEQAVTSLKFEEVKNYDLSAIFEKASELDQKRIRLKVAKWLKAIKNQEDENAEKITRLLVDFLWAHWEQEKFDANIGRLMNRHANASIKRALIGEPQQNDYSMDEAKAILKLLPDLFESPKEIFMKKLDEASKEDIIASIDNWLSKFKGDVIRVKNLPLDFSLIDKVEKLENALNKQFNTDKQLADKLLENHHKEKFKRDSRDFQLRPSLGIKRIYEELEIMFNFVGVSVVLTVLLNDFIIDSKHFAVSLGMLFAGLIVIIASPLSLYFSTKGYLLNSPLNNNMLYDTLKNKFSLPEYEVFCRRCKTNEPTVMDVLYCLWLRTRQEKN